MQPKTDFLSFLKLPEWNDLFCSLNATDITYSKNALLLSQGEPNEYICVMLSGSAHAVQYSADGREEDYSILTPGSVFGDALAMSFGNLSPVSVFSDTSCVVRRFSYQALLNSDHPLASVLLKYLSSELAKKFFRLQRRLHYITQPALRDKLLAYLYDIRSEVGTDTFTVPLGRNALAAYLFCDRSALSRELSRMKSEGLIDYHKDRFTVFTK